LIGITVLQESCKNRVHLRDQKLAGLQNNMWTFNKSKVYVAGAKGEIVR